MTIKTVSVDSVIIYFSQIISEEVLNQVQSIYHQLKNLNGIIDITPSYCSVLVKYDLNIYNHKSIKEIIHSLESEALAPNNTRLKPSVPIFAKKTIQIPTNYNERDLQKVAKFNNITIEEVIKLHTQTIYRVYAIGFMVGFAYLAEVDKKIATPRLDTPRARIPKGSVAIADNQTAIYPKDSAGGWNIIGHTEFDSFEEFSIGDSVQFVSI